MRFGRALLVLAPFAALGCGRIQEIKGCRELAALMNPVLDDIAARVAKGRGAAPYRHAATKYKKLASDLKRFDLGIPRSEKSVDELGAAMKDASVQATKLADALEQRDAIAASTARRELGQIARLQKSIATRIDGDCAGH
jgi:hypothetical protein